MRKLASALLIVILGTTILVSAQTARSAALEGDTNNDGKVNIFDLNEVLGTFGQSSTSPFLPTDLDQNGTVNIFDISIVLRNFGAVGPTSQPSISPSIAQDTPTPIVTVPTTPSVPAQCGNAICEPSESCSSCAADCGTCGQTTTIQFQASSEDIYNPERGFMRQSSIYLDQAPSSGVGKINRRDPTDSLVWVYYRLDNYRNGPLDQNGLDVVRETFNAARNQGFKLVIRFIYNPGPGSTSNPAQANPDAPLSLALQHIDQLTPLLQEHADIIAVVQAGFVGHWGEWHSSRYLDSLESRKVIVDALLTAVPSDRMLQLRYPRYKEAFYGGPMTDAQAFSETALSRVGFHNDAFLRDDSDGGMFRSTIFGVKKSTYCDSAANEIQCWRDYVENDSRFTPVGGEAGSQSSSPSVFAECTNALAQLSNQHFSFLNNAFSPVTLNHWVNQGCMPEIRRRLGYRFTFAQAVVPAALQPGSAFTLEFTLSNEGFASLYNPRPVYVVVRSGSTRYQALLPDDPRMWEPGSPHTVTARLKLPDTIAPGTYDLALWMPDAYQSLQQNAQYSVRFANNGVWDQSSGLNILTNSFAVSASGQLLQDGNAIPLQ